MNNDLISREALKKNIDKFIGYLDEDMIYRIKVVIDNVPTVGLTELCKGCQYLKDCETCDKNERPQGEWITHISYFECSICRHCYDYDYAEDIDPITDLSFNFCPNCGAKMKGGAE